VFPPAGGFVPFTIECFRQLADLFLSRLSVSASWRIGSFYDWVFPPAGGFVPFKIEHFPKLGGFVPFNL